MKFIDTAPALTLLMGFNFLLEASKVWAGPIGEVPPGKGSFPKLFHRPLPSCRSEVEKLTSLIAKNTNKDTFTRSLEARAQISGPSEAQPFARHLVQNREVLAASLPPPEALATGHPIEVTLYVKNPQDPDPAAAQKVELPRVVLGSLYHGPPAQGQKSPPDLIAMSPDGSLHYWPQNLIRSQEGSGKTKPIDLTKIPPEQLIRLPAAREQLEEDCAAYALLHARALCDLFLGKQWKTSEREQKILAQAWEAAYTPASDKRINAAMDDLMLKPPSEHRHFPVQDIGWDAFLKKYKINSRLTYDRAEALEALWNGQPVLFAYPYQLPSETFGT